MIKKLKKINKTTDTSKMDSKIKKIKFKDPEVCKEHNTFSLPFVSNTNFTKLIKER